MAALRSASFFSICFLLCSSEAQEKITAEVGQDVILPCKVPNNKITAVEWIRPEMEPDYVLLYRDGHLAPDSQHPSYQNRVDLQDKEMKDGDVSLILKNVKIEDTGRYVCRVFEKGRIEPISINLVVFEPAQEKTITAERGEDVILPCKVPDNNNIHINNIIAVEWSRPGRNTEYVLVYRDGRFDPDNQHPSYQNRVDLQDKEMKDGDFSLNLKNVTKNDTGTYECWVFQKGTNRRKRSSSEPINVITLAVHPSGDKGAVIGDGGDKDINTRDGGNKTGIIAGSVVGVILLLAAVFVGFLIYRRHMRQNPNLPVPPDEAAVEQML